MGWIFGSGSDEASRRMDRRVCRIRFRFRFWKRRRRPRLASYWTRIGLAHTLEAPPLVQQLPTLFFQHRTRSSAFFFLFARRRIGIAHGPLHPGSLLRIHPTQHPSHFSSRGSLLALVEGKLFSLDMVSFASLHRCFN